jgi:hypothetical protein
LQPTKLLLPLIVFAKRRTKLFVLTSLYSQAGGCCKKLQKAAEIQARKAQRQAAKQAREAQLALQKVNKAAPKPKETAVTRRQSTVVAKVDGGFAKVKIVTSRGRATMRPTQWSAEGSFYILWWGSVVPYKNHMILRMIFRSECPDIFSQLCS